MKFFFLHMIFSIKKASGTNFNNHLETDRNSLKNEQLNSSDFVISTSQVEKLEHKTSIETSKIFPSGQVNFDQELLKLKGFAKFVDPIEKKFLNLDNLKVELKKIEDLTRLTNQNESFSSDSKENGQELTIKDLNRDGDQSEALIINSEEITPESTEIDHSIKLNQSSSLNLNPKEIETELKRLQKFLKFINTDSSQPIDPEKVTEEIFKLIEIGKLFNSNGHLDLNPHEAQLFLERLKRIVKILSQEDNLNLNLENVFEPMGRLEELVRIFNPQKPRTINFEDINRITGYFKKICEQNNSINFTNYEQDEKVVLEKFNELCKDVDKIASGHNNTPGGTKQDLEKFKEFVKLFDPEGPNLFSHKNIDQEFERLKNFATIYDLNVNQTVDFNKLEQEVEKTIKLAELLNPDQPLILKLSEFESTLEKLKNFSEIINPDGSKLLEGEVEKTLDKFYKLAHIINKNGLQNLKVHEIENELERLNGLAEILNFNHKTLSFDGIENELERLSNLVKVINTSQQQSSNLEDIESKLNKYIESTSLTRVQSKPNSDGKRSEQERSVNTADMIQNDSQSTVTAENPLLHTFNELKQSTSRENLLSSHKRDIQSDSPDFVELEPVQPRKPNGVGGIKPVNYQGDDPNAYTFLDKDKSRVVNQPKDIKKSIEKLKELLKTIKSEIETYKTVGVKIDLPEEVKKLINLSEVELFKPDDLEKKIEIFYKFAERLKKDLSVNTRRREEKHENLERLQNRNTTRISNFEDGISEQEVYPLSNKKHKKTIHNRVSNSKDGQIEHEKSLKRTKSNSESKDKRIDRPSKSQNLQHFVYEKNKREHRGVKLNYGDNDQSKTSKISNKKLQSTTNVTIKNDLKDDEIEESDQQYGDDPNAYNSAEIGSKLVENNANVLLNNNENSQSSKQESFFYNPKKLLSARNHEEISIVGKPQDDKSKVYGEKNELHSQNERGYQKSIRKVEVGELDINITLHFTFSRSLC